MASESSRPLIVGNDEGPVPPFPLQMEGNVTTGFQRGSTLLGFPTANIPINLARTPWINTLDTGVYFGWASLRLPPTHEDYPFTPSSTSTSTSSSSPAAPPPPAKTPSGYALYPMVMSIGFNPYFKNTVRTAEVHVLHTFAGSFYDMPLRLLILGYIRPEKDYPSLEALIDDIRFDTRVARESLKRVGWAPRGVGVVGGWGEGELDVSWLVREGGIEGEEEEEGKGSSNKEDGSEETKL